VEAARIGILEHVQHNEHRLPFLGQSHRPVGGAVAAGAQVRRKKDGLGESNH
jgi:hypothetical protein